MNKAYNTFKKFIKDEKLIYPNTKILIALSGGSDSVCLFHMLRHLSGEMNLSLYAFHLNHMIREEANHDEDFVKSLCEKYNIKLFLHTENIPSTAKANKRNIEETGRSKRYELIDKIIKENKIDYAATAHHMIDNSESIIFSLARGTGLNGVLGIAKQKNALIRPMLCLTKAEILTYLREMNYKYVSDKTNLDISYARNRIRHNIVPELEKVSSGANQHILNFSRIARDANELVKDTAKKIKIYKEKTNRLYIYLTDLENERDIVKSQVLLNMIKSLGYDKDISYTHIKSVLNLIEDKKTTFDINISHKLTFKRRYDKLYLTDDIKKVENENFICNINPHDNLEFKKEGFSISTSIIDINELKKIKDSKYIKYVDSDKIKNNLTIRYRKNGDRFFPLGSNGSKKLKEYFIDKKIDRELRDNIPLLLDGETIVMIIGYEINDNYKVTNKTDKVLAVQYKN